MSMRQFISSSTSANAVTVTRGDFTQYGFALAGTSGAISTYSATTGASSTLMFNGAAFTEIFPDGQQLTYQSQLPGGNPVTHQLIAVPTPQERRRA